jgi:tripartite-type tricarboxylate transporter receptor subunit TctC
LAGFYASLWYGLWVPKDTPQEIVSRLNAVVVEILAEPAVKARFDELGLEIPPRAQQMPQALRALQKAEADKWWPIIKSAGIKTE